MTLGEKSRELHDSKVKCPYGTVYTGSGVGSARFSAANGDSLDTTSHGQGDPTATPDVNRVVETHTITDGTGGFAGATGSFTLERLVNMKTGATSGSFDGSIVLQNGK